MTSSRSRGFHRMTGINFQSSHLKPGLLRSNAAVVHEEEKAARWKEATGMERKEIQLGWMAQRPKYLKEKVQVGCFRQVWLDRE